MTTLPAATAAQRRMKMLDFRENECKVGWQLLAEPCKHPVQYYLAPSCSS